MKSAELPADSFCLERFKVMRLISARKATEILGVGLPRLYELARLKQIPVVRLGPHQIRFDEEELAAWAKRGGVVNRGDAGEVRRDDK